MSFFFLFHFHSPNKHQINVVHMFRSSINLKYLSYNCNKVYLTRFTWSVRDLRAYIDRTVTANACCCSPLLFFRFVLFCSLCFSNDFVQIFQRNFSNAISMKTSIASRAHTLRILRIAWISMKFISQLLEYSWYIDLSPRGFETLCLDLL